MRSEQNEAMEVFSGYVEPLRLRVRVDKEGWPYCPGKYGIIEWHSLDWLAVYSAAMRKFTPLLALAGMRRHQVGDKEFRLLLSAENPQFMASLGGVQELLHIRTRLRQSEGQKLNLLLGTPFKAGHAS